MSPPLDRMRADFNRLAAARLAAGLWTPEDVALANGAIRQCLQDDDLEELGRWAAWLAVEAAACPPVSVPEKPACITCAHRSRLAYCSGRTDLPLAYTEGHPLHRLPDDGGAACNQWSKR